MESGRDWSTDEDDLPDNLEQGSESPKICLVLVPLFSASPKNVLVLVPYFSAQGTKHYSTNFSAYKH